MDVGNAITMDKVQKLIDNSESVLTRIRTMLYTQFSEENKCDVEKDVKVCLEEYCYYLVLATKGEKIAASEKYIMDDIFNDIFEECRKLRQLYERQKVIEELQLIKQTFLQIAQSDTCKTYVRNLDKEARELKEKLKANEYLTLSCSDLLEELKVIIQRIVDARRIINMQVGVEAATGVLTLGTSVASGAVGIVGAVSARAGSAVAKTAAGNVPATQLSLFIHSLFSRLKLYWAKRKGPLPNANMSDSESKNANMGDSESKNANMGDSESKNANMDDSESKNANMGDSESKNANMGDSESKNANIGDSESKNANMGDSESKNANMGDSESKKSTSEVSSKKVGFNLSETFIDLPDNITDPTIYAAQRASSIFEHQINV